MEKYYITTAIAYTSSKPHLGNTYEIVLADSLARYKRKKGFEVYFQTGTDEHGEKIENKAKEKNISPQEYVDKIAEEIKNIWDIMNTSYDNFVRTTDEKHIEQVQKIFRKFYEQGDIYKGEYFGLYCVPCESFWTESQLAEGKCPDCGRKVEEAKEEAYFFKMSKYAKWLEDYINSHSHFIEPEARKKEIINNFIKPGLQDLCVSRTSFKWGIPVDFDDKHVIYVWIDALSNYITFLGYDVSGNSKAEFQKYWPADLHLIGKDILRFHTIYWPIMLHALGLELPEQVFGHPWMLFGEDKMSKSKGNIVYADDLVTKYGVDAVRYYMLHEMPFAQDGTYTNELLEESINSNLANVLGNLVNRTLVMVKKYFAGIIANYDEKEEVDELLIDLVLKKPFKVETKMNSLKIADALDEILDIFKSCNKYIDATTPWNLVKDKKEEKRLATILYNLVEAIRFGAILLEPFMPDTSHNILKQINVTDNSFESLTTFGLLANGHQINEPEILFSRLERK